MVQVGMAQVGMAQVGIVRDGSASPLEIRADGP
jgi:hypothetical protein